MLARYGSPEQQEKWLVPLLNGETRSAFAMTERFGAYLVISCARHGFIVLRQSPPRKRQQWSDNDKQLDGTHYPLDLLQQH